MDMGQIEDTIVACERKVWDALVAGDATADGQALADTFWGVYPDGFAGKADHVGQLAHGPTVTSYDLTQHRVMVLADDTVLLSYHASFQRVRTPQPDAMFVSSIWQNRTGTWLNVFSQDTPA